MTDASFCCQFLLLLKNQRGMDELVYCKKKSIVKVEIMWRIVSKLISKLGHSIHWDASSYNPYIPQDKNYPFFSSTAM